jgi:GNAT superfamily N-acetyltransferase
VAAELREILPPDTGLAYPAIAALRPTFTDEAQFVERVDDVQRAEGYRLVGIFEDSAPHAVAIAGFRVGHMLAWGRFLYVDDLSTLPEARRKGYGRQLLDWLTEEAQRLGCDQLHLDSGVRPDRIDAHRLYFNAGLAITSFHFARQLED